MEHSTVSILDLCDEMLLNIFNKLNSIDVLYSFIGANQKLDKLAQDITFTRSIDLVTILSNENNDLKIKSILDRFCLSIIPRIQHNIECLILDALSIERVLSIGNYSKLHRLTLVNLQLETASRIFNHDSSFVHIFKHKISHLTITNDDDSKTQCIKKLSTNIFITICTMFTNLTYLHFGLEDICHCSIHSLIDLTSTPYNSSNIIHLNVRVDNFNDCLYLLNGQFSQLQTLIIEVDYIRRTSMTINNTRILSNLKCFSLTSYRPACSYDNQIVPLLRQMSQLQKLTLSLIVLSRNSFIDGNHLVNDILSQMPYLHTFNFNIISEVYLLDQTLLPAPDDIGRALIERGFGVMCYIDCASRTFRMGRCHIYSLPFTMERIDTHSRNFPGGLFMDVRYLAAHDFDYPFDYDFFVRISQAFPLLKQLKIVNRFDLDKKLTNQQNEDDQTSPIIEFSHLMILDLSRSHIDYIKLFLCNCKTRLPCFNTLYIKYIDLEILTKFFTTNAALVNCSKLQRIIFGSPPNIYPENFYRYFPLLCRK